MHKENASILETCLSIPKVLMSKLRKPPRKMRKLQMKSNPAYFVKRNVGLTRAGMEPVEARDGDKFCNGIYIGE